MSYMKLKWLNEKGFPHTAQHKFKGYNNNQPSQFATYFWRTTRDWQSDHRDDVLKINGSTQKDQHNIHYVDSEKNYTNY